jgi:hypothetical protein
VPSTRLAFDDAAFDEQLPVRLQVKSSAHVTPVEVRGDALDLDWSPYDAFCDRAISCDQLREAAA